ALGNPAYEGIICHRTFEWTSCAVHREGKYGTQTDRYSKRKNNVRKKPQRWTVGFIVASSKVDKQVGFLNLYGVLPPYIPVYINRILHSEISNWQATAVSMQGVSATSIGQL